MQIKKYVIPVIVMVGAATLFYLTNPLENNNADKDKWSDITSNKNVPRTAASNRAKPPAVQSVDEGMSSLREPEIKFHTEPVSVDADRAANAPVGNIGLDAIEKQQVSVPTSNDRAQDVVEAIKNGGEFALQTALVALSDADENVRTHALHQTISQDLPLPSDTIQQIITSDTSAIVRAMALTSLLNNPDIDNYEKESIALLLKDDKSPVVQSQLQELLQLVEMESQPNLENAQQGGE